MARLQRFIATPLALGLAAASLAVQAEEITDLDTTVVTAAGFEQRLEDAPASLTVIDAETLRKRPIRDLGDALRDVEGVVVNGAANETDISIRGMPGDYTLILVDGKRQSARESRVNGNRGYEQSFIPPAAAIERIEVVRGPMSSLYGSDAIGGVINIITKKNAATWHGSLTTDYIAQQHRDQGNSRQGQFFLSGPLHTDLLGLQLWGRYLDRQADDDIERTQGFSKARHRDLTGRLALTPNENHEFLLEAGQTRLRNGDGLSDNWATRQQDNDRDHWSLSHTGHWTGGLRSDVSLLHEETSREGLATPEQTDVYGRKPQVENTVFDAKLVTPLDDHLLTTGLQYNRGEVQDWNQGLNDRRQYSFAVTQQALFAEDEWAITDSFALTGGLRLDHHELYGNHWSPRLYGVWHATPEWTFKGGVSRGFKAPEIRAVAPGYAYLRRNRFVMLGNPDLKPETSTNYEVAALWSNRRNLEAAATLFYNDFQDKLSTVTTTERWNGYIRMDRINVDEAVIRGVELSGGWDITEALRLGGNFTYLDSEQRSGPNQDAPLALTPERKANVRLDWTLSDRLNLWTALDYYGEEYDATLTGEAAPAYTTWDVGGGFVATRNLSFNAAIRNLNDRRLDDETYGTVNYGRHLWVSATLSF
ncbi:TonB-dependent receptor domain-containing protein [Pseudomonas oryzihabitans]|uniref:TonB-dependent receptor domain-containing protein n=1 Tax=Pseudomonas oryzihabitans TaxID=47885 RepID=UPI0016424977|nr:TonB-dependent receptor [Pseudomonas oryzihabitans]